MNDDDGTVTEPGTIRFERLLPGPLTRVWSYLTESERLGEWLAPGLLEPKVGGRVELRFNHSDLSPVEEPVPERYREHVGEVLHGTVTKFEPPRLLSFTWAERSGEPSEVTFELSPRGDTVLLRLTHRHLGERRATLLSVASGWHTHLAILSDRLEGRTPRPFWSSHLAAEAHYDPLLDDMLARARLPD